MAQSAEVSVSKSPQNTLLVRIISASVMLPVAVLLVVAGGWWLTALILLGAVLMVREWDQITGGTGHGQIAWVQGGGLVLAIIITQLGYHLAALLIVLCAAVGAYIASADVRAIRGTWPITGTLWIGFPCVGLLVLSHSEVVGVLTVLWLMVVVWACDSCAYFAGRAIGGPKLLPSVSPKKTWAGLIGGILAAAIVGAVMAAWTALADPLVLAGVSAVIAAFSQVGDLAESAFKRHFGVKDSGRSIPGHGGVFDRVDGLLFAIVLTVVIAYMRGGSILPWH